MRSREYVSVLLSLAITAAAGSMLALSSGRAAEPPAPPGALTEQDAGRAVYQARCETCHGLNGRGTKGYEIPATGPALKGNPFVISAPETAIAEVIRKGRTGARRLYNDTFADMPSFDGTRIADLRPLLAYLKGDMQQDK